MHLRLSVSAVQIKSMASRETTVISVKLYNGNWRRRFWCEGSKAKKDFQLLETMHTGNSACQVSVEVFSSPEICWLLSIMPLSWTAYLFFILVPDAGSATHLHCIKMPAPVHLTTAEKNDSMSPQTCWWLYKVGQRQLLLRLFWDDYHQSFEKFWHEFLFWTRTISLVCRGICPANLLIRK